MKSQEIQVMKQKNNTNHIDDSKKQDEAKGVKKDTIGDSKLTLEVLVKPLIY